MAGADCPARYRRKAAMSGLAFLIAVGGVSLLMFGLMFRSDRVRDRRRAYADSTGSDGNGFTPGNSSFSLLHWLGGTSSFSSDDSCSSSSYSSYDSGSGSCGDGGGGSDGGGGGGGE